VVIEHTGCALHGTDGVVLRDRIGDSLGLDLAILEPAPDFGEFADLEANLRAQVERIRTHPLLRPVPVHGLIFDVRTGRLHEIA
jgi:carbonic anhydrase